jgi:hypothetical protein
MAVTMKQVRAALDPEEPSYAEAAKLGPGALPHLETLVSSEDTMLASKAAYLASLIRHPRSASVIAKAARSSDPAVRVAAAAAASKLPASAASAVLLDLVDDSDPGVRKFVRKAAPGKPSPKLAQALKAIEEEPAGGRDVPAVSGGIVTGLMPGETPSAGTGGSTATMPGERAGGMPGEHHKMPGE